MQKEVFVMSIGHIASEKRPVARGSLKEMGRLFLMVAGGLLLGAALGCLIKTMASLEPFVRWFVYGCAMFAGSVAGFVITEARGW